MSSAAFALGSIVAGQLLLCGKSKGNPTPVSLPGGFPWFHIPATLRLHSPGGGDKGGTPPLVTAFLCLLSFLFEKKVRDGVGDGLHAAIAGMPIDTAVGEMAFTAGAVGGIFLKGSEVNGTYAAVFCGVADHLIEWAAAPVGEAHNDGIPAVGFEVADHLFIRFLKILDVFFAVVIVSDLNNDDIGCGGNKFFPTAHFLFIFNSIQEQFRRGLAVGGQSAADALIGEVRVVFRFFGGGHAVVAVPAERSVGSVLHDAVSDDLNFADFLCAGAGSGEEDCGDGHGDESGVDHFTTSS